jgi:hypothetical protein
MVPKHIITNQEKVFDTERTFRNLHDNAIRRNQELESAQAASMEQISTKAGEIEHSLQRVVQWELPAIDVFLQNYLQHLMNFTQVLSEGNSALEAHISRNNEKLQQQAEIIAQVQTLAASDDMAKWVIFFILIVLLQSLSPWLSSFLAVVLGLFAPFLST